MAYEQKGMAISLKASTAVAPSDIYKAVKISASDTFAVCAAGEAAVGFIQNEVAIGEAGQILVQGITFAHAGAAIAAGALLEVGTGGALITKTTGATVGMAVNAATQVGQIFSVLIQK